MGERNPQDLALAREFLQDAAARLDIDPAVLEATMPHLLGLTKHIAHRVVRPAAPLTAFLVGLAAGQNLAGTSTQPAAPTAQGTDPETGPEAGPEVDPGQVSAAVLARILDIEDLIKEFQHGQA